MGFHRFARRSSSSAKLDVYGAFSQYTDRRWSVIQAVKTWASDNTLIVYISGDNGESAEGHAQRHAERVHHFNAFLCREAQYSGTVWVGQDVPALCGALGVGDDTPFKWREAGAAHFGGTAQGMCISWPGHINDLAAIRRSSNHVIDIVPTILEATAFRNPIRSTASSRVPSKGKA